MGVGVGGETISKRNVSKRYILDKKGIMISILFLLCLRYFGISS